MGGAGLAALVVASFTGGPAAGQAVESYLGRASGRVLGISVGAVLPQASLATSSSVVDSSVRAAADAAGALGLPLVGGNNAGAVEVRLEGARQATGEQCATPSLPAPLDTLLTVGVACSDALAEVVAGDPHGRGTAKVATIDLSAQALTATPIGAVQGVLAPVLGTLDTINATLPVPDLAVTDTLTDLLTALGASKTLEVRLGRSSAEVTTSGGTVASVATSEGGVVSLLPLGVAGLKPVVEIVIGSASATAVYDRSTGTSTPSFDPAIVTVRINTPTTDAVSGVLGQSLQEIKIAPDLALPVLGALASPCADAPEQYCVLPGTPFETRIAVASGRTATNPDGSVSAVANGVRIEALRNIGPLLAPLDGGIVLEIAQAQAAVAGSRPPADLELPRELPRTGGTPWVAVLGAAVLGAALVCRRLLGVPR